MSRFRSFVSAVPDALRRGIQAGLICVVYACVIPVVRVASGIGLRPVSPAPAWRSREADTSLSHERQF